MEQALTFESRDEFNRKPIAEKISKLLQSDIDVSPMVIDGGWGTGKSEFCQKLIALMNEQAPNQYHLVYVDAFRTDHTGEPLLALLAEIIKTCVPVDDTDESKQKRQKIIATMAKGAKFAVKTGAKALLAHVLKQDIEQLSDEWEEIVDDKAKELGEKAIDSVVDKGFEKATAALLQEQIEAEQNLVTLQANLRELAQEKPIILFIDELDRCRPDYAIDMLEIVKHVFNIENVKIVLITNLAQLRAAVNHRYGDVVDSHKYLDKFVHTVYRLPIKNKLSHHEDKLASIQYFWEMIEKVKHELMVYSSIIYQPNRQEFINSIFKIHHISLRETETIVRNFRIYSTLSPQRIINNSKQILVLITIILHCLKPELLQQLLKGTAHADDLAMFLKGHTEIKRCLGYREDNQGYAAPNMAELDLFLFFILLDLCGQEVDKYDEYAPDIYPDKNLREQCYKEFFYSWYDVYGNSQTVQHFMEEILTTI